MTDAPATIRLPEGWSTNPQLAEATIDVLKAKVNELNPPPSWDTPGAMAAALDPTTVQTPALELIDEKLAQVAAGELNRLIITMPPQEGKSERTTHYGALWMLHRNPGLRIGIVSYGERVARRFSMKIRNDILVFNGRKSVDLGLRLQRDSKAAGEWQLAYPRTGSMFATGIGGALTGQPLDILFIDDPVKDFAAAQSDFQSAQAWDWWDSVARTRLAPGAPVILIQTRWHENDLAGRLIKKQKADEDAGIDPSSVDYDRWTVINIPAQANHDPAKGEADPLGRRPGEFLQSARGRTQEQWQATKLASSPRTWAALYQGTPAPDNGDVLLRTWWRWYESPLWSVRDGAKYIVEAGFDEAFTSWDMTFKDTKGTDYVVGQVWMRRGANAYLLDQVRARMSFTETMWAFQALANKWPQIRVHIIEDKANGPAVISSLRKKIPGLVPVSPGQDSKLARAEAISPFVEAGNVHLPADEVSLFMTTENQPQALVNEAATFPNGAHDDMVDALSQALNRFFLRGAGAAEWAAALQKRIDAAATETSSEIPESGIVIVNDTPMVTTEAAAVPDNETTETAEPVDALRAARNNAFRDQYR